MVFRGEKRKSLELCPYMTQSPLPAALSSMSFVTTACGAAAVGSPVPPDPCAHSGAATKHATSTVAHHRAQCVIPTSVEGPTTYSPAPSENPRYMLRPGAGSK